MIFCPFIVSRFGRRAGSPLKRPQQYPSRTWMHQRSIQRCWRAAADEATNYSLRSCRRQQRVLLHGCARPFAPYGRILRLPLLLPTPTAALGLASRYCSSASCFWARVGGWSGASLASVAPASSICREVASLGRESAGVADMLADIRCFWARGGGMERQRRWVAVFHRTAAMMEAAGGVDAMLTGASCLCLCSLSSRGRYWRRQRGRPQQVEK